MTASVWFATLDASNGHACCHEAVFPTLSPVGASKLIDHQAGIFREGTAHHIFLEFSVPEAPAFLPGRSLAVAPVPAGEQVIGFGRGLMAGLGSLESSPPSALADFSVVAGSGKSAPASQRDLFIWLHGEAR
ncbi:MAG: hypothetical protein OXP11_22570, partial [Gammaproteobacteria bacterium]|nr:hypothetical protein [Gammaproteobacteria bacterium]